MYPAEQGLTQAPVFNMYPSAQAVQDPSEAYVLQKMIG
jgi:hypothetical protein